MLEGNKALKQAEQLYAEAAAVERWTRWKN